jgi:hypothetical protein
MGGKNLRTLKEYSRADYGLRVECHCGRVTILDPHRLLMDALARRVHLTLAVLEAKLRCQRCGRRPKQIGTAPR